MDIPHVEVQSFKRPHHQRIARLLAAMDGDVLRVHHCFFAGGTCIALRHGEFRESVDIDFLVSDAAGYRALREMLNHPNGLGNITREGAIPLVAATEPRVDQYGIRTQLLIDGLRIKFEIVREGNISLEVPSPKDTICGISTLTALDLAACKLLANSDRRADDSVLSRDVIDLAMMDLRLPVLKAAMTKAQAAYGASVARDLVRVIERIKTREGWLERCMQGMSIDVPKAVLWQKIHGLMRVTSSSSV